jgi:hypothetical protein
LDIAFAISITDEILRLQPLEDKLLALKKRYEMSTSEIFSLLKQRLTFFALFSLFDTVELNHNDSQAAIQKLMIHIKKQDNEIERLKRSLLKYQTLEPILDEQMVKKILRKVNQKDIIIGPEQQKIDISGFV